MGMKLIEDVYIFFFFKQKTAYERRISDWSSDVCSSDLLAKKNVIGLGFSEAGFRNVINNVRPVKAPADLKGMKLRVQPSDMFQIGRASCRERVCQYV